MVDQVLDALILRIAEGRFRDGAAMPAVRALAVEAGCSSATVVPSVRAPWTSWG